MNVVFLDYDGVVNTPMWDDTGSHCRYNFPEDNSVNNFQCVQWVSEFCQKYDYNIVVTSTWRTDSNYIDCLKNGGLRDGVEVLGKTPVHHHGNGSRGSEIHEYLAEHPEISHFLIFDDYDDFYDTPGLYDHFVECDTTTGFGLNEYLKAERMHEHLLNEETV